jgi:hypothetical protein
MRTEGCEKSVNKNVIRLEQKYQKYEYVMRRRTEDDELRNETYMNPSEDNDERNEKKQEKFRKSGKKLIGIAVYGR